MGHRNGVHKYKSYFQAELDYIWIYPLVNGYSTQIMANIARTGTAQGIGYIANPESVLWPDG